MLRNTYTGVVNVMLCAKPKAYGQDKVPSYLLSSLDPNQSLDLKLGTKYDIKRTIVGIPPCVCHIHAYMTDYSVAESSRC